MKNKLILLVVILSLPAIFHLFSHGFFVSDDGEWMIIRFSAFYQAAVDGQLPVRFLSRLNFGYGYPVANFLYPGFMYLALPIHIVGFGFVDTIKIILGLSMILSSAFTFLWLKKFFAGFPSLVGSLIYLYAPYHLYDLWTRGSVGEVLALAVAPFVFWQIERKSFFWTGLGLGFLILSHNILALLFFPVLVIYMYFRFDGKSRKTRATNTFLLTIVSLMLSAFFSIPAILELQYVVFSKTNVSMFESYFSDISLIGPSLIFVVLATGLLLLFKLRKYRKHLLTLGFLALGLLSILMATELSYFVWNVLPVSFVQFPFRFLSLAVISASFLSAFLVSQFTGQVRLAIGLLLIISTFIFSAGFITPSQKSDKGEGFYATNEDSTTVKNEYMPKWVRKNPDKHFDEKLEVTSGNATIKIEKIDNREVVASAKSQGESLVRLNTIYYPGWRAFVDDEEREISYDNEMGVMDVEIPNGESNLRFTFGETNIRIIADLISVGSFIGLIAFSNRGRLLSKRKK